MKNFKDNFLRLIDNGANQAKGIVESFNDLVNSFDIDAHIDYFNERKRELIKKSGELFNDFAELLKQVKDSLVDFSVSVPFDESIGEQFSYEVKNGKLSIEVTYKDEHSTRCNSTSVIIPNNCDLENVTYSINKLAKTLTITIPKVVNMEEKTKEAAEEQTVVEEEVKTSTKTKTKVKSDKPKAKVVKKKKVETTVKVEEQPTQKKEEETKEEDDAIMSHISEKLAKTIQRNASKYAQVLKRDEAGRFVRKEVKKS